jgi:hypothetical protein
MKTTIRPFSTALALAAVALAALALAASSAPGAVTVKYPPEGFPTYEAQLSGGQIKEVTINKRLRTIRVTLTDGRHVLAKYSPHEEPRVVETLKAHHIPVFVLTPAQAAKEKTRGTVHHKIRYIAGGVLIAIIVIVGGVWLYNRRKRAAEA